MLPLHGYSITAAFLIQFNVILPSLESILSPFIHHIEFLYSFFRLFFRAFASLATLLNVMNFLICHSHFYAFAQFVHCLTFQTKMSCETC